MLTDHSIRLSNATLRITESDGPGMPIVMVHGTASSRAAFDRQLESPLADTHRLIAVDLPGHGESKDLRDAAGYSLGGLTAITAELLARLRLGRFVFVGWSLGGHIGMELLSHPDLAGLMIVGAPPVGRGSIAMLRAFHASWDMLLASKETYTDRDVARFFHLCFKRGASIELLDAIRRADGRVRPAVVRSLMRGECSDQRQAVEQAQVPVAIINGRDDPFVRLGYLDGLKSRSLWYGLPQVIEDAGHAPFWDQPETFNALLEVFAADAEETVAMPQREALSA